MRLLSTLRRPATYVAAAGLTLAMVGGSAAAHGAVKRAIPNGGTATVTFQSDFNTLDPALSTDVYSNSVIHALFVNLVEFEPGGKIVPWAASSWTVAPNGLTYTFHIKPGIQFTDGEPVNAQAFAYGIERVLNPATKSPGSNYFLDVVGAPQFAAGKAKTVSGISTPNASTIVFHLIKPERVFIDYVGLQYGDAVPAKAVTKEGANFAHQPVGDGPFMLQTWVPGQKLVIVKNPKYFDKAQAAHLNSVVFQIGGQSEVSLLKAEQGQVDVLGDLIPPADFASVDSNPKWKPYVNLDPIAADEFIYFDEGKAPFNNMDVREAAYWAIDQSRILQLVAGQGAPTGQIIPPGVPGHDSSIPNTFKQNVALAKQLLVKAGYKAGTGPAATFWVFNTAPGPVLAQAIQQELDQVGFKITIKSVPFSTLVSQITQIPNVQFGIIGWVSQYPDPVSSISSMFETARIKAGTDLADYNNAAVNAQLVKADALAINKAVPLYEAAQKTILSNYPWVPLYNQVEANFVNPRLGGFSQDDSYWFDYANWYIK